MSTARCTSPRAQSLWACLLFALLPIGLMAQPPTPTQLIGRYRLAHGLPPAGDLPALSVQGTSFRGWRTMPFRRWHAGDGTFRSEVDMGGSSTFILVADAAAGWEVNPYAPLEGPSPLDTASLAMLADERHAWPAFLAANLATLHVVQTERTPTGTQYHLQVRRPAYPSTFILDSATSRLVEARTWLRSATGRPLQVQVEPSDFRLVRGLHLPHLLIYRVQGQVAKRDSIHQYRLEGPSAPQLRYPNTPNRPKTFGFRADHPAERKLLQEKLPPAQAAPRLGTRDGRKLQPVRIAYAGVHKGLHPDWVYQTSWELAEATTSQGRRIWRLGQNITSSARDEASGTSLDYSSLLPIQDVVGYQSGEVSYQFGPDSVRMSLRRRLNNSPTVAVQPTEQHSLPNTPDLLTLNTVDAVLASLPLRTGFRVSYTLLYEFNPRPFVAVVSGTEAVSVGDTSIPALVVELLPQDGDRHAHTVLYLRQQAPHIPLRRRYVVHPVTLDANTPKSMGNEDATAIRTGT